MPEVTRACSASRAILLHLHLFLNKLHALCNSFAFSCHVTAVLKPFPLSLCWINNSLVTEMLEIHFFFFLISMWKWWVFPPRSMCVWPGMCEHWWGFSCKSTCVPEVVRAQSQLTEEHYWGKTAASSRKRFPDTTACYTESYHGRKGSRVKKEKTISRGFVKGKPAVRGNACLQLVGDRGCNTYTCPAPPRSPQLLFQPLLPSLNSSIRRALEAFPHLFWAQKQARAAFHTFYWEGSSCDSFPCSTTPWGFQVLHTGRRPAMSQLF